MTIEDVLEVKDVRVTRGDIRAGQHWSPYGCPIALAVSRAYPDYAVGVSRISIQLSQLGEYQWRADLPNECQQFIRDFDYGKEVAPISFQLKMEPYHRS